MNTKTNKATKLGIIALAALVLATVWHLSAYWGMKYQLTSDLIPKSLVKEMTGPHLSMIILGASGVARGVLFLRFSKPILTIVTAAIILMLLLAGPFD